MGKITDNMILEAVRILGTPSKKEIYNYIQSTTRLSRDTVVSNVGKKLKNLVIYKILSRVTINNIDYFFFPDSTPSPTINTETTINEKIWQHIACLPVGSKFTVRDIQDRYGCTRWVAYRAIQKFPGLIKIKTKPPAGHEYVKGAVL